MATTADSGLTVDQLDHHGKTSHEVYTAGFYENDWDFVVRTVAIADGQIRTPLYIIDADGDQFFGGQPAELAGLVPGSTLVRFAQADGASFHCQPLARELTEQRMLDWWTSRSAELVKLRRP